MEEAWPSPPLSCSAHARTRPPPAWPDPRQESSPQCIFWNQSLRPAEGPPSNPPGPIFWAQGGLSEKGVSEACTCFPSFSGDLLSPAQERTGPLVSASPPHPQAENVPTVVTGR